ncbi:uncharacterized protein CTRU02_212797 [Colletotrichum truncatum]|uniref:Uncharacterized protein n=1 Tax=Colletotrichum truncatum TaxID=5467 RepID=A0ACC3YJ31_COLTU|nr:uncharacterized protein CTRU02_03118 [Colletotrichum truncatum]KAF6797087.1 hypothetical protein CTRU02_03118 [Colletotrichum truncatum]
MKVLCLGLGRTGTASLRVALKQLGFQDTYHMLNASAENPPDCLLWSQALAAKYDGTGERFSKENWDALLGHCQAVCDWPAASFASELIEAYPDAKVILTTRDADSWYKSTKATVNWRAKKDYFLWALSYVDWASSMYYPMLRKYWDSVFMGDFEKNGKAVFLSHNEQIRELVPPDNLLELRIGDGWDWEPLCKFLGCPIPAGPFPRVNEGDSFLRRVKRRNYCQVCNVLLRWLIWGMVGWGLMHAMRVLTSIWKLSPQ